MCNTIIFQCVSSLYNVLLALPFLVLPYHPFPFLCVVILTGRDGRISKLEQVYLRGGQIKFVVLPEALKSSPIFKKVQQLSKAKKDTEATAGGRGRGRGAKRPK